MRPGFELDLLWDKEPIEVLEDRVDVTMGFGKGEQTSKVLDVFCLVNLVLDVPYRMLLWFLLLCLLCLKKSICHTTWLQ